MPNHIIRNDKGSPVNWSKNANNEDYCLLYNDNNGKYTFTPTENLNCQLYMFGGGGAGGYFFGGGGGAGAAYINKNYTFEKNKTYTFDIGAGGKCDIDNIDLLFSSGLLLKVFNNTSPTLNNFSFIGEDYSNLNIDNNAAKSYIVQDINIDTTLFTKNTTYIWEGYIKGNVDKNYLFSVVSNLKTFVWIQDFDNDDMNSLNVFNNDNKNKSLLVGGYNLKQFPFSKTLKNNVFYKIKIIAYNDSEEINNFTINIDRDCSLFNFNKNKELYKYIKSSDTILTYNNNDGTFGSIKCIGGGNGGCGLYNQDNSYLNGGCGGGAGLNKIKGISKIQPIYNGFDGAVGAFCGGGGGIKSAGSDSNGGDGLILNWFNDTLIFGAGGNASGNSTARNLGYGCGGNGGTCCYYKKSATINNNGNNGCILIYIKPEGFTIEGFEIVNDLTKANTANYKTTATSAPNIVTNTAYNDLISESLNLKNIIRERADYFSSNNFGKLCTSVATASSQTASVTEKGNIECYLFDMLLITKLYTTSFNLINDYFNNRLYNDVTACSYFMNNLSFKISAVDVTSSITSNADNTYTITLANVFTTLTNMSLTANIPDINTISKRSSNINTYYNINPNCSSTLMPIFHTYSAAGTKITAISNLYTAATTPITSHVISFISNGTAISTAAAPGVITSTTDTLTLNFNESTSNTITKASLSTAIGNYNTFFTTDTNSGYGGHATNIGNYQYYRVYHYINAFYNILNATNVTILPILKYYVNYYNVFIYNLSIQYQYYSLNNEYMKLKASASSDLTGTIATNGGTFGVPDGYGFTTTISSITTDINTFKSNLDKLYNDIKKTPYDASADYNTYTDKFNKLDNIKTSFSKNQTDLNATINRYNTYLTMYNNLLFYYKLIIAFAIFLTIVIIIIFSSSLIDNNTKISIYIIILVFIIILLFYYNNNVTIEDFSLCFATGATKGTPGANQYDATAPDTTTLQNAINELLTKEILYLTASALSSSDTNSSLFSTDTIKYIDALTFDKSSKKEYYKIKNITLSNNIEIMKKSINYYYYLIVLISILIVILIIGLILFLLAPQLLLQIVIFCVILIIIDVYFFTYRMHRSTRIYENKNYWANYNPSADTLNTL
jgi:hypothetical protein